MGGGFGGFRDGGPRSGGGDPECSHPGWNPIPAPAGRGGGSGGGFGAKKTWWKCTQCGMEVESRGRPQPEDFEGDDDENGDDN